MKGIIIVLFLSLLFASEIISATTIWRSDNEVMSLFEKWMVKHGKVYNALGEKAKRFEIFKKNLHFIDEYNKNFPKKTYMLGLNVFADLTDDEYKSRYLGTRIDPEEILSTFHDSDEYLRQDGLESLPDSVETTADIELPICPGKVWWPELVGANGDAAAAKIEKQNPYVRAIVLKDGTPVTKDFRCDRVRVWVNKHRIVIRTPVVG